MPFLSIFENRYEKAGKKALVESWSGEGPLKLRFPGFREKSGKIGKFREIRENPGKTPKIRKNRVPPSAGFGPGTPQIFFGEPSAHLRNV